jgi:hypothetical protein
VGGGGCCWLNGGGGYRTDQPAGSLPKRLLSPLRDANQETGLLILILRVLKSRAAADVLYNVVRRTCLPSQGDYIREPCGKKEYQENGERKYSWKSGISQEIQNKCMELDKMFTNFSKVRSLNNIKPTPRRGQFPLHDSRTFKDKAMTKGQFTIPT